MFSNIDVPVFFTNEEEADEVFITEDLGHLGKEVMQEKNALVDCACPRIVAGKSIASYAAYSLFNISCMEKR